MLSNFRLYLQSIEDLFEGFLSIGEMKTVLISYLISLENDLSSIEFLLKVVLYL